MSPWYCFACNYPGQLSQLAAPKAECKATIFIACDPLRHPEWHVRKSGARADMLMIVLSRYTNYRGMAP